MARQTKKPSIISTLLDYKETIGLVIVIISTVWTGYSYIVNYFATQEQLQYSHCLDDKNIHVVDLTMRNWADNEGLQKLQNEESLLESQPQDKLTLDQRNRMKQLSDLIQQFQNDVNQIKQAKEYYTNLDCVAQSKVKPNG